VDQPRSCGVITTADVMVLEYHMINNRGMSI